MTDTKSDVAKAKELHAALAEVDGKLAPELKAKALTPLIADAEKAVAAREAAERARKEAVDKLNAALKKLREHGVRVRAAVKVAYGGDSLEYQKVGGTRTSERKRPTRKPKAESK